MAKITIDGITKEYPQGTAFEEIARQYQPGFKDMIALVAENRKIRELHKKVERDCSLSFLTIRDDIGHKTYVRTGLMILVKAINDVLGKEKVGRVKIEFAIGQGYYCKVIMEEKLTREHVSAIGKRMAELVEKDLPITKKSYPKDQAIELFRSHKLFNKEKLFR